MKMMNDNAYDVRFADPNANFSFLMNELQARINNIEVDLTHIQDPEIKGLAQKVHSDLCIKYFNLMRDDLKLQKMFEEVEENGVPPRSE